MKKFKEIFLNEGMKMPNNNGIKRVQSFNSDVSVNFLLDDESRDFLKKNLSIASVIYEPTLKKLAENIIILNRQKHRMSDESRISLMNKEIYQGYREASFYTSIIEA
ncbi:TPA: hypothetical protein TUL06_001934 [Streptococcus equi subsp. zooepidemicus]|uniref:hypothetical protein n=1 Tax=Streptococcus equi TaxID=1336 RepID=UPI001E2A98CC|nr:hypothetical protein [Streptococcus equi]MCD3401949.1 hypothetical protein [Streptococcus equi subsp. zooepidemicus]UFR16827.1 hypothetical protein KVP03_02025 [Streptococcus equi subsp. zooepidemicus]HEL0010611.1 hypothetical protein [Streptococcus equi subsp. zooepidemicus]HEL0012684.1 hypothetical protein [Streptococcus equi subsp. zooepidemicus]HEL0014747.1 hypothetical protein [Streptococcus equi subsp. zooepidemicus]